VEEICHDIKNRAFLSNAKNLHAQLKGRVSKNEITKYLQETLLIDISMIDSFYFLHLLMSIPSTSRKLTSLVMQKICKTEAHKVYLIFVSYNSPSIKDLERTARSNNYSKTIISITSPDQKCPPNFIQCLKSSKTIPFKCTQQYNRRVVKINL
jgi:hypothetical protein